MGASPNLYASLAVAEDFFDERLSCLLGIAGGAGVERDLKPCHRDVQCVVSLGRR